MSTLLDELTEEIAFQIRQSRTIQLARVDAYLDGVVLAAEQVQDVRLSLLEEPTVVNGWEAAGSVLLTFALESTIAGKALAKVAKTIFTPVLRMNSVFRRLPKSADGHRLMEQARRLARMNDPGLSRVPGVAVERIYSRGSTGAQTFAAVLQAGAGGKGGLQALGKENIILYHAWLEAVIRGGSASTEQNLTAIAKSVREARNRVFTAPSPGAAESKPVQVRALAYDYASLTRTGIQYQHDRLETLVRGRHVEPLGLEALAQLCSADDLNVRLIDIRKNYAVMFEALIWAQLYGCKRDQRPVSRGDGGFVFGAERVDQRLQNYWLERFEPALAPRSGLSLDEWNKLSFSDQSVHLKRYFWDIVDQIPRL